MVLVYACMGAVCPFLLPIIPPNFSTKRGDCMETVRILSFDMGTANTACSMIVGNLKYNTKGLSGFRMIKTDKSFGSVRDRIDYIGEEARKVIQQADPTHIAIEDFTEQGKFVGKTYKEMAWLTEHFRILGRELGYEVAIYENGYWKKVTMGAMRVNKQQVQHYVCTQLPEASTMLARQPDHVWDSVGIGLCCWKLLQRTKLDRGK